MLKLPKDTLDNIERWCQLGFISKHALLTTSELRDILCYSRDLPAVMRATYLKPELHIAQIKPLMKELSMTIVADGDTGGLVEWAPKAPKSSELALHDDIEVTFKVKGNHLFFVAFYVNHDEKEADHVIFCIHRTNVDTLLFSSRSLHFEIMPTAFTDLEAEYIDAGYSEDRRFLDGHLKSLLNFLE